jgi:CRISPR-associated protein Cas1
VSQLRQKFLSHPNLEQAWKKVAKNKGCAGVDGETIPHFAKHPDKNLKRLQRRLQEQTYQPLPLRQIFIPKDKGKWRELHVPSVRDRIVQQALLQILHPILEADFEESSYAYRPQRSYRLAAEKVAHWRDRGYDWILDGDIVRYFDNILHSRLLSEVRESIDLPWILDLIKSWITVGVLTPEGILIPQKGIPQGAVISPILANVYLDDFDEYFNDSHLKLVRYADDFVILAKKEKHIHHAKEEVEDILQEIGLELHDEKSQITNFSKGLKFLGHTFTEELMLPPSQTQQREVKNSIKKPEYQLVHSDPSFQPTAMQIALLESLKEAKKSIPPPLYVVLGYQMRQPQKVEIKSKELIWSQAMSSLYLVHQGANVKKEQGRFLIEAPEQETVEIPIQEVERIMIFGHINLSISVIETCLNLKIPVVFLTQLGEYKGHLESGESINLECHKQQFRRREETQFRLTIAQAIVQGKILNSKQLLLRLNRKRKLDEIDQAIKQINSHLDTLENEEKIESLFGHEGNGAAVYFSALGKLIMSEGFSFTSRNRRPPKDPFNSLLSTGYTLLFNNVMSLILAEGLSPYLGNLHQSQEKRPELAMDLMEEFRSPVVDSLVLQLVNKQVLKPIDFTFPNAEGGVYLTDIAKRIFFKNFEQRLNDKITHPDVQTPVSYRRAIQLQIQRYQRSLLEDVPYQPFLRTT